MVVQQQLFGARVVLRIVLRVVPGCDMLPQHGQVDSEHFRFIGQGFHWRRTGRWEGAIDGVWRMVCLKWREMQESGLLLGCPQQQLDGEHELTSMLCPTSWWSIHSGFTHSKSSMNSPDHTAVSKPPFSSSFIILVSAVVVVIDAAVGCKGYRLLYNTCAVLISSSFRNICWIGLPTLDLTSRPVCCLSYQTKVSSTVYVEEYNRCTQVAEMHFLENKKDALDLQLLPRTQGTGSNHQRKTEKKLSLSLARSLARSLRLLPDSRISTPLPSVAVHRGCRGQAHSHHRWQRSGHHLVLLLQADSCCSYHLRKNSWWDKQMWRRPQTFEAVQSGLRTFSLGRKDV